MKLSVIIPVYNERASIVDIINKIKKVPVNKEIIVVDDASTDGTQEILRTISDIKLVVHSINQGKGCAVRSGLKVAEGDIIIIQDADLEYNPLDYLKLLRAFNNNKIGAVYGSRFKGKSK
ncbi:MAG: glycosyltransferase family 2 protein, partial [candidate division WOR-3 bacterium]|nr:glycosyltransferase family 2 protein [candidate division WOR-3 bacterium]